MQKERKYRPIVWNEFIHDSPLNETKKYIDTLCNIDSVLQTNIKFKNSGNFDNLIIFFSDNEEPEGFIGFINPIQKYCEYQLGSPDSPVLIKNQKVLDELTDLECLGKNTKIHQSQF